MDDKQYKIWWELHRRVAKGATLSEEEKSVYETGRAELQAEEWANLRLPSMNRCATLSPSDALTVARIEQQEETIQFLRAYTQLLTEIVINDRD